MEILNSVMMRDKQNFIKYEQLNRMDMKIEDNRVINFLKVRKIQPIVLFVLIYFLVVV